MTPAPARRRQKPRENEPRFDLRTPLHQLTGVDLSQIDGIGPYNALRLVAEIGTDMARWPTARLRQRAANLGFDLVNRATGEVLGESVSQEPLMR